MYHNIFSYICYGLFVVVLARLFLFFVFITSTGCRLEGSDSADMRSFTIDIRSDGYVSELQAALPEKLMLQSLTYGLDFRYYDNDILSLMHLQQGTLISRNDVIKAFFYLRLIGRLRSIILHIYEQDGSYRFHIEGTGHHIFSKLSISGIRRDKNVFQNMYLLDICDRFDMTKHTHSLEGIKKYLHDLGYCAPIIEDKVIEDVIEKKISVGLHIKKGHSFYINAIKVDIESLGSGFETDIAKMKQRIADLFPEKMRPIHYSATTLKKIKKRIRELLTRYGFNFFDLEFKESVHIDQRSVSLFCKITLEKKKEFIFLGNSFFKKEEILEQLLMYGKSLYHFPSSIIIDEISQLYKDKGFWNVQVTLKEEAYRTFCVINEGVRVKLVAVEYKDIERFTEKDFHFITKPLLKLGYVDKELIKKSLDMLIYFYQSRGFWDVAIVHEAYVPVEAEKKDKYSLHISIHEGQQRTIGLCTVKHFEYLDQFGPFQKANAYKGQPFNYNSILEQKAWLMRYFKNAGYRHIVIEPEYQEQGTEISVVWHVDVQGQAMTFGKVLVAGSSKIPTDYITREIAFKEGDAWSKDKIEETLKRLKSLDLFETIQMYPSRDNYDGVEKPIFIKVIDASTYELRTKLGVQQVGKDFRLGKGVTYKVGGSFLMRNPGNKADMVLFEGDYTRYYRNSSLMYNVPWFCNKAIRSQYKVYDSVYDQPVYIGSKNSLYQANQIGFLWNLTKEYTFRSISGSVGIEWMGIKEAGQPDLWRILDYDPQLVGKRIGYLFFEPTLMWQHVDSMVNPKKGYLSFLSCKGMIDLNTRTSFLKIVGEHSYYLPLLEPLRLAVRMRIGHVFNRCYQQLIPIERFYLGGANTIRGYERDYCPPLGLLTCPVEDEYNQLPATAGTLWRYAPQGGRTMLNINTEVRFRIYRGLLGAVFNDIGALFKDSIHTSLRDQSENLLGGSGFGLRYETPIGPLRFDVGFKWNRTLKNFETRCVWYLTLGQAI